MSITVIGEGCVCWKCGCFITIKLNDSGIFVLFSCGKAECGNESRTFTETIAGFKENLNETYNKFCKFVKQSIR